MNHGLTWKGRAVVKFIWTIRDNSGLYISQMMHFIYINLLDVIIVGMYENVFFIGYIYSGVKWLAIWKLHSNGLEKLCLSMCICVCMHAPHMCVDRYCKRGKILMISGAMWRTYKCSFYHSFHFLKIWCFPKWKVRNFKNTTNT